MARHIEAKSGLSSRSKYHALACGAVWRAVDIPHKQDNRSQNPVPLALTHTHTETLAACTKAYNLSMLVMEECLAHIASKEKEPH